MQLRLNLLNNNSIISNNNTNTICSTLFSENNNNIQVPSSQTDIESKYDNTDETGNPIKLKKYKINKNTNNNKINNNNTNTTNTPMDIDYDLMNDLAIAASLNEEYLMDYHYCNYDQTDSD